MLKRLFHWYRASFFIPGRKTAGSIAAMSALLLFCLFCMGNGHVLAKTPRFVQPFLLMASTNHTYIRSASRLFLQVSAPTIRLKPTSGVVGTSTTVVGDRFAQKEIISVSSGRWLVAKTRTDKKGHFTLSFHVPLLSLPGFNLVKAISANKKQSASASFKVVVPLPSASLTPNHGLSGAHILIKGKNFTHKGRIVILFVDPESNVSSVGITVASITASTSGTINTHFTVPGGLKKKHVYKIDVLDIHAEHSVSFNFTIK